MRQVAAPSSRSHRAAAVAAADDAFQRGDYCGSGHGNLDRFVVRQDGLYLVPDTFGDNLTLVLGEGDQAAEKHPEVGSVVLKFSGLK